MRSYPALKRAFDLFVQRIALPWSKPQLGNLILLATAFACERSLPLRRLARAVAGPFPAHRHLDKRFRRFLGNRDLDQDGALRAYLRFLLPRFAGHPFIPVMLDWTDIHRQRVILWGQIPYRGRAFPLCTRVFAYGAIAGENAVQRGAQTAAELAWLERLARCWPASAPPPLLLADRGFPKVELVRWLQKHGWYFLIRCHHNQELTYPSGRPLRTETIPVNTTRFYRNVQAFGARVPTHFVITRRSHGPETRCWRLLTNLPDPWLPRAPQLYAHRMQPEQTHRDCKHGHFVSGYALAHLGRMQETRLENLLFCVGLWTTFLILLAESEAAARQWLLNRHWGLSLSTFGLDLVRFWEDRLPQAIKQALDWVKLKPLWLETGDS